MKSEKNLENLFFITETNKKYDKLINKIINGNYFIQNSLIKKLSSSEYQVFKSVVTNWKVFLLEMYNELFDIFIKYNIPVYPIAGTLLGFTRNGSQILFDDDEDFIVSYNLLEDNLDEINFLLSKNKMKIEKTGISYYSNNYYVYKLISEHEYGVRIGNHTFKRRFMIDLFPAINFGDSNYFDQYETFLRTLLNGKKSKRFYKWIVNKNYKFLNNRNSTPNIRNIYNSIIKDYKKKKYYSGAFNFDNNPVIDGNYSQFSVDGFNQKPRTNPIVIDLNSNFGKIKYLKSDNDKENLKLMYGKNWVKVKKNMKLHLFSKYNYIFKDSK